MYVENLILQYQVFNRMEEHHMKNSRSPKVYISFYLYLISIAVGICGVCIMFTSNDMSDTFYQTFLTGGVMLVLGVSGSVLFKYPVGLIACIICMRCVFTYYMNKIFHIRSKRYRKCRYIYMKCDKKFSKLYRSAYHAVKNNSNIFKIYHS